MNKLTYRLMSAIAVFVLMLSGTLPVQELLQHMERTRLRRRFLLFPERKVLGQIHSAGGAG